MIIDVEDYLSTRKEQGRVGVKLHPRFGGFPVNSDPTQTLVESAVSLGVLIILCGIS